MTIRIDWTVGWVVAALTALAAGQSQPAPNPPLQSSVNVGTTAPAAALSTAVGIENGSGEDTSNTLPQIPSVLGGIGISPALLSELEKSNYLRGGFNLSTAYDTNPLLASSGAAGDASVSIFPNLSIEQTSSRARWKLGYAGGLTINQRFTNENEGSHNLNFDSQYRLSPHVNLRVAETFSLTTGIFDAGAGSQGGIGTGGPNASLLVPLSTQRSTQTTVETNYHVALNDLVGASGSFYDLHFSNLPTASGGQEVTTTLTGTDTATGSAFWLHQLFRGDWAGTSYRFARISFSTGESRVHSFFAVNTFNLSSHLLLTGYIGPQYAENNGIAPGGTQASQTNDWSLAGGVEGGWRDQRTNLLAGYSRSISDGGGVLGTVRLQNVYGNFRRELVPGWAVAFTASHGGNDALLLAVPGSASAIHLTSAGVSLERNVGQKLGLRLGYTHDWESETGLTSSTPTLAAQRDRFFVTFSYEWAKPFGM